jgi:hypothetical protein
MAAKSEPNPRKNVLRASPLSFMNFMPEQYLFDKEQDGLVRFRAMFEMPNWDGVEAGEYTYVIDDPNARLDKLAVKFWGDSKKELYWVLAARNGLDLPDAQLYKGRKIKIPSLEWIETKLLSQAQGYLER